MFQKIFFYDDCGGIMRLERIIPMIGQSMRYAYPSKITVSIERK